MISRDQATNITYVVLVVLIGIGYYQMQIQNEYISDIIFKIALVLGVVTSLIPKTRVYFAFLWMKLGHILGWVNSRILLSVVFFFVLLPIATLRRLIYGNLMTSDPKGDSAFVNREHTYGKSDIENIW